jgi:hypothetical protein
MCLEENEDDDHIIYCQQLRDKWLVVARAPIGFGNYRTEPTGFGIGPVSVLRFTEPNPSVNLPIGFGNFGFGIGFAIYRTELPNKVSSVIR